MKAYLMYRDRDFKAAEPDPPWADALVQDLELATLVGTMARNDKLLADVGLKALLLGTTDLPTILYRQAVLGDCLKNEAVVREIYDLAGDTIQAERKNYLGVLVRYPGSILSRSVEVLRMLAEMLEQLREIADKHAAAFESEGFQRLFAMLQAELDDSYFAEVRRHLAQLKFPSGVVMSGRLGEGNKGVDYVLRKDHAPQGDWFSRLFTPGPAEYSYRLPDRDEAGTTALGQLRDQGINLVADALAQSTDHVLSFFVMLRTELAFYVGALNLYARLRELGEPVAFADPLSSTERRFSTRGLYDVCLALRMGRRVVDNDVEAEGKDVVIITGPNTGGKSTFLRSVGLAQLMMQSGMYVPAEALCANVCERIFTHYKREEDVEMQSGKFDEELKRMSRIVERLVPNSLVLFNESFAATNEREGSEIARQITTALVERNVEVFFVTHQYDFASGFHDRYLPSALFLRAERLDDGTRTFKIKEGRPLETSYGEDLYREIFEISRGASSV